jgi:hypothetical protein
MTAAPRTTGIPIACYTVAELRKIASLNGVRSVKGRAVKFSRRQDLIEALQRLLGVGAVDQSYLAQCRRSAAL